MDQFEQLKQQLTLVCPSMTVLENPLMSQYTTFRVGGPVPLMALPADSQQAAAAVRAAAELGIRPFFLGNGSNLLVPDRGAQVFVINTSEQLTKASVEGEILTADSGCLLRRLAGLAQKNSLTGMEFAHGIPGSLGGAVTMNAGAYGGEMRQIVRSVTVLDPQGSLCTVEHPEFSYRHSAFSDGSRLILSAELQLSQGDPVQIQGEMDRLMEQRKSKQPLEWPSAGSTFKRPKDGYAAALIDRCGLKGTAVGGAQVSEKHAGFVINRGGATCQDILDLMALVRSRVLESTGIALEPEVRLLGEEYPWKC